MDGPTRGGERRRRRNEEIVVERNMRYVRAAGGSVLAALNTRRDGKYGGMRVRGEWRDSCGGRATCKKWVEEVRQRASRAFPRHI